MNLQRSPEAKIQRAAAMAELYAKGQTLQEIGDRYGITRERVRQILSLLGITRDCGGSAVRQSPCEIKQQQRERAFIQKKGMTRAEYKSIRKQHPGAVRAFFDQKRNASRRGIGWNLNFAEWWFIWQQSGKWNERGRGKDGYVMARHGDTGPYDIGNVSIVSAVHNQQEDSNRFWDEVEQGKRKPPGRNRKHQKIWDLIDPLDVGESVVICAEPSFQVSVNSRGKRNGTKYKTKTKFMPEGQMKVTRTA